VLGYLLQHHGTLVELEHQPFPKALRLINDTCEVENKRNETRANPKQLTVENEQNVKTQMLISKAETGDHKIFLWLRVKPSLFVVVLLWPSLFWLMSWIPWIKDEYQILHSLVFLLD